MNKKKIIISIGLIFIFLFILVLFSPWKMNFSQFKKDCESYCKGIEHTPRYGLECQLPIGGCYDGCIGFKMGGRCTKKSECFDRCEATCFGLTTSPCAPSIFERKINFLSQ